MLRGIDISSHQATIRWNELTPARTQFVVIKATGGGTYKNPRYGDQLANARRLGKLVGHYHYAHELSFEAHQPYGRYSPEQEADHFCNTIQVLPGEIVALDIEEMEVGNRNLLDWASRWLARVEARLGFKPFVYSFPSYITEHGLNHSALSKYPLWYAYYRTPYNDALPGPRAPGAWANIAIWQWSGGTPVRGFDFPTDENLFFGDEDDFRALGKPGSDAVVTRTPTFQHAPGFLEPVNDTFGWGGAGIIVSREIVVYNDEDRKYYRRRWHADSGLGEWEVL